jgi:hypothetical protein
MSPRRNWDSPTPSPASECAPTPGIKGGGDTRVGVRGWGSPNSDDWRKSLAFCLLCEPIPWIVYNSILFIEELKSAASPLCGQVIELEIWTLTEHRTKRRQPSWIQPYIKWLIREKGRGERRRGGLAIPSQLMNYTECAHINHTLHLYFLKIIECSPVLPE